MQIVNNRESVETTRETSKYKVNISRSVATERSKKAWVTRRKNGTTRPWNKGVRGAQVAWNKGLDKRDPRVLKYSTKMARTVKAQFKNGRKQYTHTAETNRKIALGKIGRKNPSTRPEAAARLSAQGVKTVLGMHWKGTSIERILWRELRRIGVRFKKNHPLGWHTIPDAYLPARKIAIYADGDYWHNLPNWKERDARVNAWLKKNGYTTIRFWEHDIKSDHFPELLRMKI